MKLAYQAHRLDKHQIKPLRDHVIVTDMTFNERISRGGLILLNDNGTTKGIRPRWAQVYAVGPDQKDPDLQPGKWILVSHGRWTRGIEIEDEGGKKTLRRVDPNDVLLASDEIMDDETFSDAIHIDKKPSHMLHN
jgi:co-chaperonin GroES (HSP10)